MIPLDATEAELWRAALEQAALICEAQQAVFLSPAYTGGQPLRSFPERFACAACAGEIRKAADLIGPHRRDN